MNEQKLNDFLKDLTCASDYRFLEQGKDDKELKNVCEKRGIAFPNIDLAVLKIVYGYVNRTNLNGCNLPREEVEKALPTIIGKAIDFDHVRERVVGFLLDAKLEGDEIIAYGAFFKSSLGEDFELIKELFDRKNLAVSFEAWGQREFNDDGKTYNLKDIIFCGLGLLINTKPAFPGAGVVEMANKRVLEFAKLDDKKTFIHEGTKEDMLKAEEVKAKKLEASRLYTWDMESIMRIGAEVICPMCKSQGTIEVNEINFKQNNMDATCWMCNADMNIVLTPKSTMMLKDTASRTISKIVQKEKKEEGTMSEVKTETPSIEKAEDLIKDEEVIKTEEETVEKAEVEEVVVETIEEVIKEAEVEVKAEEVAQKTEEVANAEVEALKKELATLKEQLVKARDEGKIIGERRSFLGEFAKDMSDDDVLDMIKFENASLKKKVAELESKKAVKEEANAKKEETPLEIGSKDKQKNSEIDVLANRVRTRAFSV